MTSGRGTPPPAYEPATEPPNSNASGPDPPSSMLHGPRRHGTALAVTSASVGILAILLMRWNLDLSSNRGFTETTEFGLWTLMVGIESAIWILVGSALLSQYAVARAAATALIGDEALLMRIRRRSVLFAAFVVVALVLPSTAGLMLGLESQSPLWGHEWKSTLITVLGIASALPGALCLSIYHDIARNDGAWPSAHHGRETVWFDFFRGRLRTVIALLSLEIALLVFVNSLLRRALTASSVGALPSELVLAYAGLFSAVLVGTFMYVRAPLQARAEHLVNAMSRIPGGGSPSELAGAFSLRSQLRSYFALDRSLRGELEEVGLVALPLLTALFSETAGISLGG